MSEPGVSVSKLNAAFSSLFSLRGIPQIYGDEIAKDGRDDPDSRHDFSGDFREMREMRLPESVPPAGG
jgi:glycosidase